jgi:hypothetical protein
LAAKLHSLHLLVMVEQLSLTSKFYPASGRSKALLKTNRMRQSPLRKRDPFGVTRCLSLPCVSRWSAWSRDIQHQHGKFHPPAQKPHSCSFSARASSNSKSVSVIDQGCSVMSQNRRCISGNSIASAMLSTVLVHDGVRGRVTRL